MQLDIINNTYPIKTWGLTGIFQKGKKSLKMPKRLSESVNRRIDNTMVKRKKN
jgi:hypothetical protein